VQSLLTSQILRSVVLAIICLTFCADAAVGQNPSSPLTIAAMHCEYLTDPIGIDVLLPRLSWELLTSDPKLSDQSQSAYQILAASSSEMLANDQGDLWDSEKVESDQSIQIPYDGKPLESCEQVWWKVRIWDAQGRATAWSKPATWSMGLLNSKAWNGARWIGLDEAQAGYSLTDFRKASWIWFPEGDPSVDAPVATRYFRRSFNLPVARWKRAECFLAADDAATLYLNGKKIGEGSGNANLVRIELSAEDFVAGTNVLAMSAANKSAPVPKNPAGVVASLRIEFEDGVPPLIITTDNNWRSTDHILSGWQQNDFDDAAWLTAKAMGQVGALPWGDPYGRTFQPEHRRLPARMLRKEFSIKKDIKRATATVCGLGFFDLYLNGEKISDHWFDPGLTEYSKRCLYVTFDVTDRLNAGENAIGVILGNGRFFAPRVGVPVPTTTFGYPKLFLNLHLQYDDGSSNDIVSGDGWKITTDGPIRANNEYDGEEYDARREQDGWAQPGFNDTSWQIAQTVHAPGGVLQAQMIEPVRNTEILKPVSITEPKPGIYIVDFGQSFYGVTRLKVRGPAGTRVEMRSSFALRPDGLLKTENDRSALNTDVYILRGTGQDEIWNPRFKGTATRRVQVTSFPGKPTTDNFEGLVLHTDFPSVGIFACSNDLINHIFSNARWGTRMQDRSIPMEPDRDERQGWSGHPAKTSESEGYNFNIAPFYANWLRGVDLEQHPDGSLQEISPGYWTFSSNGSIWPAIVTIIPNWMYDFYADRRVLAANYDTMKRWVEYHVRVNQKADYTLDHHSYDDWVDASRIGVSGVPDSAAATMPMISTAYHYYNCHLLARAAGILGKRDDAVKFNDLADHIKSGFNHRFFNAKSNQYGDGRQFSYVLPLAFGLVPDENRQAVIDRLIDQIMVKDHAHTSVGLLGTQWEMQTLTDIGHPEVAYAIATQTTRPSWGYMIAHGATTIWERWDTDTQDGGMNGESQKILSGNFEAWCYQTLAGINYDPAQPGFKHIILHPRPVGDLKWVRASHHCLYGEICSSWQRDDSHFHWDISIPVNTTATLYVPADGVSSVKSLGEGIKFVRMEPGAAVYEAGSGNYSLDSTGLSR
jgi:alpha-L-rhamnosidase